MLLPLGQPFQETWQFKVFLLGKLVQEILLSTHSLPRAIIKYWLPARWASGFSGDHQQNHQCFWFHSCYNVTHVSCPSLFVFCWEWKLLLLLIMLVELLSPCNHPTKDHSMCTLDITQSVFMEELTKDTSISPVKMRYGVSFVRAKSAQSLTPARDLFHRCGHS